MGGPNLTSAWAKLPFASQSLPHCYARERVLEVYHEKIPQRVVGSERLAAPLLILHAVEHRCGVACTRQSGPRADNSHNVANGISALVVALGSPALTPSAPSREMGRSTTCARECGSPAVRCSATGHVRGTRSPQQFTLKAVFRI